MDTTAVSTRVTHETSALGRQHHANTIMTAPAPSVGRRLQSDAESGRGAHTPWKVAETSLVMYCSGILCA
jgi:hypothetical protein